MRFEVDVAAVRAAASAMSDLGLRVAAGGARTPVPDATPRWATSDAAAGLAQAAEQDIGLLGDDLVRVAQDVQETVADYLEADDRAARRLRDLR